MTCEYLKQNKKLVSVLLLGLSTVCAVLILIELTGFSADSSKANTLLQEAVAQSTPDAGQAQKRLADSKAIAEQLKKNNLFAPPQTKQHPVSFVSGIMGNEVLINDTWYKIGQMVGDAKIVAIEPTQIKMEWDGNEKVFAPIDAPAPATSSGPRPGVEVAKAEGASTEGPQVTQVSAGLAGPGMGRFGNLSEQERAAMRERFEAMRGQFESMSEAERDRFRSEMRDRFGGGPPGGGQGRGPGGGGDFGRRGR